MLQWHALHTKPHKERQVQAILASRSIKVFFPTVNAPRERGHTRELAFFPSYVFAHTDLDRVGLWGLQYLPGMHRVVMCGDSAATVPDQVIVQIQDRLARAKASSDDRTLAVDSAGEVLERGDRVRIQKGPFADLEAIFDGRLSPEGRVRVLVQLLEHWSRGLKVDLPAAFVTKKFPVRTADFAN